MEWNEAELENDELKNTKRKQNIISDSIRIILQLPNKNESAFDIRGYRIIRGNTVREVGTKQDYETRI